MTHIRTDDTRIEQGDELLAPMQLMREIKASDTALQTTFQARNHIHDVLRGADDRLVVVVGPCSIHDPKAALEYARKLKALMPALERDLVVIVEGPQLEAFVRAGGPLDIDYDPEETACVLFTGGRTGFSKGVMLSSRGCLSKA